MASTGGDDSHPDMTPMLDLVMQLLMYFILCANFLGQEVNAEVVNLPESAAAVPRERGEGDYLVVIITAKGEVVLFGKPPMNMDYFEVAMQDAQGTAPRDKDGKILTTIILRADRGADYGAIYQVLNICKKKGFRNFNTRMNIGA